MTEEYEGLEQIRELCLMYLMRARQAEGSISIKCSDPRYLMNRLYEVRKEQGMYDIMINIPDKEGEIWLTKRKSPSER